MPVQFSVVIPLFNKSDSIQRAIHSVLSQTAGDFEIIVIDDGSTDGSAELVRELNHPLIKLIYQENAGVAAARNKGIFVAQGKYIALLDADDCYHPDFLKEIKALITEHPDAGMYCSAYEFKFSDGRSRPANIKVPKQTKRQLIKDYFKVCAIGDLLVSASSVVIPKSILNQVQGFPVSENMGEDQSVWSQIALDYSTAYSARILSQYHQDVSNGLMQTVAVKKELYFSIRLQKLLDLNMVDDRLRASVKDYISGHILDLIRRNFISNHLNICRTLLIDIRSRRQLKRWGYWYLRTHAAIFFKKIQNV